jgi:hypothetical protein
MAAVGQTVAAIATHRRRTHLDLTELARLTDRLPTAIADLERAATDLRDTIAAMTAATGERAVKAGRCHCNAVVCWARMPSGRRIPLDAEGPGMPRAHPDDGTGGRIQETMRTHRSDGGTQVVNEIIIRVLGEGVPADPALPVWRSHWATGCSDPKGWART